MACGQMHFEPSTFFNQNPVVHDADGDNDVNDDAAGETDDGSIVFWRDNIVVLHYGSSKEYFFSWAEGSVRSYQRPSVL